MRIDEFQTTIDETYGAKDAHRGVAPTFLWLVEEIGELARAVKSGDRLNLEEEFADCLAWLSTVASLCEIDLDHAATKRYGNGCPKCGAIPCRCAESNRFVESPPRAP